MTDAFSIAAGGIRTSTAQFAKSAENVVKATRPDAKGDLATAIVDGKQSEIAFKANVATFKAADSMTGTLLDILT